MPDRRRRRGVVWWAGRYAVAIHRLTRGVGDTVFYGADGQPWFRLDEQRHDVPLDRDRAGPAARGRRRRGSRLLPPSRHRSDRCSAARSVRDIRAGGRARRRQHADAAARAHAVPVERADARPQGARKRRSRVLIEAQLTKTQILELYLNRIYLSAGVYGVETMSQHLFGKPAQDADAAGSGADCRPDPRAVGAVAVVESRRRRRAQPRRARRGCARRDSSRAAQEAAARQRTSADPAVSGAGRCARRATRRSTCGSSSATSSAATIRPTGRCTRRSCPTLQEAAEQAVAARAARGSASRGLQAALVAIDPPTGEHPRAWSAAATSTQSAFNRADPQPAAARVGVQAVRLCGRARSTAMSPVSVALAASMTHQRPADPRVGAAQRTTASAAKP